MASRTAWFALAVAVVLGFAIGTTTAKDEPGMALPAQVMEFARTTRSGGGLEMEVDASGKIIGLEAEIAVASLPKAALDLAQKLFPDAKPVGAEKEWIAGVTYHEVVLDHKGTRIELLVKEDGTEGGREEVIAPPDVPKAILDAADKAVPGGTVEVVEKVTGAESAGRGTEYHVKKLVDGEVQRISVSPEGKVALVLRKMKAEVRHPR